MKKTLLLVGLISSASAFAQITVTEGNVVDAGDQVIQNSDTIPSVSGPTTGANQTWDYSTLVAHEEDTMFFVAPGWLPNASEFPSATLALDDDGAEIYLEKDATGLRVLGIVGDMFGIGTPLTIAFDPYETIIEFPANFNDSYSNTSTQRIVVDGAVVGLPVDSVAMVTTSVNDVVIDSWGSMTTPYGTFDVLGQYETSTSTDSTFTYILGVETLLDSGTDTTYSRSYWSNDPSAKFPVMEMEVDELNNVVTATWLKEAPSADVALVEMTQPVVFPNPAKDVVNVKAAAGEVRDIVVYDVNGAVVAEKHTITNEANINIEHLTEGTYVLKALNSNGEIILTQEVIKL